MRSAAAAPAARAFARNRIVLVGEAAHVVPPVGAQGLNRSLLTDLLPVQGARGLGLYALDRIGPLRRAVMREGVAPRAGQPRLMRGEAI